MLPDVVRSRPGKLAILAGLALALALALPGSTEATSFNEVAKLTASDAQSAVRAFGQTYEIALRLHRGEAFHGED